MELSTVRALYDTLSGDRLTFLYSGLFHDDHTARLITLGEEFLEHEGAEKSIRGKLAFIMVEAYQNIIRHRAPLSPELEQGAGRSMFLLRSMAHQHEVSAVNPVTASDAASLSAELERLRTLDLQQMKQVFLRGLQSDARTERGGAGLGLIEMARRSGHELHHAFGQLDGEHQVFALQALIGRAAEWRSDATAILGLHRSVVNEGISVLCRGRIAAGEQEVLLRIIERDLDDDRSGSEARTRAFLATAELLEKLGAADEGPMIMLCRSGTVPRSGKVSLLVGVPLGNDAAKRLAMAVEEVNTLDAQGLQRRYRDILLGRGEAADTLQLGLIELARRSSAALRLEQYTWRSKPFLVLEAII